MCIYSFRLCRRLLQCYVIAKASRQLHVISIVVMTFIFLFGSYMNYLSTYTNDTHYAPIKRNGLDTLLNDIRPKLLHDPKLKQAFLPSQSFFLQDRTVKEVNCRLLINGNVAEAKIASNKSLLQPRRTSIGPKDYVKKTSNCKRFIAERGYVMSSLTSSEAAFPIAFSILM